MAKRTITKWWIWGIVAGVGGGILATVVALAMAAHIVDLTASNRSFVPDTFFWTMIFLLVLTGIVFCGGNIAQLVAQIGAVFNTHRLADHTWFRGLLWGILLSYLVLFVTLGLQIGFSVSGSIAAGFVWPGYVAASLIGFVVMVSYVVAGPDGMAGKLTESTADRAAEAARAEGLVQT
jgi:MFS family permease